MWNIRAMRMEQNICGLSGLALMTQPQLSMLILTTLTAVLFCLMYMLYIRENKSNIKNLPQLKKQIYRNIYEKIFLITLTYFGSSTTMTSSSTWPFSLIKSDRSASSTLSTSLFSFSLFSFSTAIISFISFIASFLALLRQACKK